MPLVRNLTPFDLIVSGERYQAPVFEAAAFATVNVPETYSLPVQVQRRREGSPAPTASTPICIDRVYVQRSGGDLEWPIGTVWITDPGKPLTITVDQLRSSSDPSRQFRRTVTVENCTGESVDITVAGDDPSTLATLGPGDRYVHETSHANVWIARSAFSNEIVSAFVDDEDPARCEISHQITGDYRRLLAEHAPLPSPMPGNRPVVLIGGKRETRPAEDRIYITTEDRDGPVHFEFNGRKDVVTRRVKVVGAKLIWSATDNNYGLMSLQGKDVLDLESIEMVADEVVISSELRFPGTNVSITARRIEFADKGMVDTSPPVVPPPDFKGPREMPPKTYVAEKGATGPSGGSVTLIAQTLITGAVGKTRICTRGGQGGPGERGGVLAYTQRKTHAPRTVAPKESADRATIQQTDLARNFRAWWKTTAGNLDGWSWPGGVEDPYHCEYEGRRLFYIGTSYVTSLLITAHDDALVPETDWLEFPEGNKFNILGRSDTRRFTEHRNPSEARPVPGDGADAYPGGRPGDGGAAGVVWTTPGLVAVVAKISDTGGGAAGPTTAAVDGAPPGEPKVALLVDMAIARRNTRREPKMWVDKYSANPGKPAAAVTANPGPDGAVKTVAGTWLRAEAVDAVLAFARAAFRDGHREAARRAIEPYYVLFRNPSQQQQGPQFSSQAIVLSTMRENLLANLDYYGNPPGWLPRLSVSSNLALFNTIRKASYQLLYFATTTERKFDDASHRSTLAGEVRSALENETTACQTAIAEATKMMVEARRELSNVINELGKHTEDLGNIKNWAEKEALTVAEQQRIFKGVMQVIGGAMQALPIGQPYLGAGGNIVGAVGAVDFFTSDKPGDRAKQALTKIGEVTDSFLEDNADLVAGDLPNKERRRAATGEADVKKLAELITHATGEASRHEADAAAYAKPIENQRLQDLEARRTELAVTREAVEAAIKKYSGNQKPDEVVKPEDVVVDHIDESGHRTPGESPKTEGGPNAKKYGPLTRKAVSLQRELQNLTNSIREVDEDIKDAEAVGAKRDARQLIRLDVSRTALVDAKIRTEKLAKAKEQKEAEIKVAEEKSEATQEKYAEAIGRLKSIGTGIGGIGAGIGTLATPVSKDDTVVKELAANLLKTRDPQRYQKVIKDMEGLGKRKNLAIANLLKAQSIISSNVARMAESLTAQHNLGRQLHDMDNALDVRAKQYLHGMRQRAEEMFHSSMYYLVMSYRYEALEDLPDSLVNYDRIVAALQQLQPVTLAHKSGGRMARPKAIARPNRTIQADTLDTNERDDKANKDEPANLVEAVQAVSIDMTAPDEKSLTELDDAVLKFELSKLGVAMADKRQHLAVGLEAHSQTVRLTKHHLEQLSRLHTTTFNLVNDCGVGRYTWVDARIVNLTLKEVHIESPDPDLNLRVDIRHSGESIINIPTSTRAPVYYYFRAAPTDDPISWGFNATSTTEISPRSSGDSKARTTTIKRDRKVDLGKGLAEALQLPDVKFEEYLPSAFSDITVEVDPGSVGKMDTITYLEFEIEIAKRPTLSHD